MPNIDWKLVWDDSLKNKELFPVKIINKSTVSISCPTRFSNTGQFAIDITPSFNENSIVLELLVFNDNLSIDDLEGLESNKNKKSDDDSNVNDRFNRLANQLTTYELSNRVMERFKIKSDGFESNKEAENALVDYINNKATESGRMFDDKLDSLNDVLMKDENFINIGNKYNRPNYNSTLESINENRRVILTKVESILKDNYRWKSHKNEAYSDSVMPLYDKNNKLAAVVSIVDDCIIVDVAKGITAKVSMIQSDEDIETELVDDIDAAKELLFNKEQELDDIKDAVAGNPEGDFEDMYDVETDEDEDIEHINDLSKRVSRLESLYINRRLFKR